MPVIESKFTFFKMIIERLFLDSTKLRESGFCETPKALNTVNMGFSSNKFVLPMVYSKVLFVPQINQSIITPLLSRTLICRRQVRVFLFVVQCS